MQTPEQSAKEILSSTFSGEKEALSLEQTPIIHVSEKEPTPTELQRSKEREKQIAPHSEEDILQGLVYPPPPSFYENMRIPSTQPKIRRPVPPPHSLTDTTPPPTSYAPSKTAFTSANTNSMELSHAITKQRSTKKSRTWIWVVATIMGLALIASCSLCGWVVYGPISKAFQEAVDAQNTINAYYTDLQARNYVHAYTYLALDNTSQTLTQAEFVQRALQQDSLSGPILTYTPNTPSFSTDPTSPNTDISQSVVTIQVGRKQKQYTVTLKLHHTGNYWKITEYSEL